jgi:hypothetical protein
MSPARSELPGVISVLLVFSALAAAPAAASPAPDGLARLAADVSARASERGVAAAPLLAPITETAAAGLPGELVAAKVLEGLAKGAPPYRIVAMARALAARLASAEILLGEARQARLALQAPRAVALADLAAALGEGVPLDAVRSLVSAARSAACGSSDAVVAAARILGELAHRGVAPEAALPLAVALAAGPAAEAGAVVALFDEYRAEGGRDPQPFLDEAARRARAGEPLEDLVDRFGETGDHVMKGRDRSGATLPRSIGHGAARGPGTVLSLEDALRGRGRGKSK